MNDTDLNVRKQWLILLFGIAFLNILLFFLIMSKEATPFLSEGVRVLLYVMNVVLLPLIYNYLIYRCAYKKPGTKLLSFILIASPIVFVWGGGMLIYNLKQGFIPNPSALYWILQILAEVAFARWYFLCYKMKKINQRLQKITPQ